MTLDYDRLEARPEPNHKPVLAMSECLMKGSYYRWLRKPITAQSGQPNPY
jgi:hypothetical protein